MTEPTKIEDLSPVMEHILLAPQLSETDVGSGCELAKQYAVAAVIVRPSDLDLAINWLRGSPVVLGTVIDVPNGYSTTAAKLFAARDALRRGAKEIETVMNTGKLISRQFQYLETELLQMADACHASGAILKVTLESEHLNEELKIVACRIARRVGADFLSVSTLEDIILLGRLKAITSVSSLDQALAFHAAGCHRLQSTQTPAILEAWKANQAEVKVGHALACPPKPDSA